MCIYTVFLVAQMVKNLPATQETQVRSLGQEDPQRRKWQPTPVFLPGKSYGQRSLAGYIQSLQLQRAGHNLATEGGRFKREGDMCTPMADSC